MKREEELTVSVKPLTWEHDGSRYHAYCRITDTRYVANNEGEKREREAGRAARILRALLPTPTPEAEPVGYADLGHIARKESAGSIVYPFPTGTCRAPLYAHSPKATDDWFSQVVAFFVKHGMLDERDEYDIRDIMAALHDNYEPEAEGVDRQVHHSKPVVSQNTQIVEGNATEGGAHEKGLDDATKRKLQEALRFSASRSVISSEDEWRILRAVDIVPQGFEVVPVKMTAAMINAWSGGLTVTTDEIALNTSFQDAWSRVLRAALTAKQTDGRGE